MAKPPTSIHELCRRGALGDAITLVHSGYTQRPVINRLRLDWPGVPDAWLMEVYQLASQACAEAALSLKLHPRRKIVCKLAPRIKKS